MNETVNSEEGDNSDGPTRMSGQIAVSTLQDWIMGRLRGLSIPGDDEELLKEVTFHRNVRDTMNREANPELATSDVKKDIYKVQLETEFTNDEVTKRLRRGVDEYGELYEKQFHKALDQSVATKLDVPQEHYTAFIEKGNSELQTIWGIGWKIDPSEDLSLSPSFWHKVGDIQSVLTAIEKAEVWNGPLRDCSILEREQNAYRNACEEYASEISKAGASATGTTAPTGQ